jgi:hypothetical protein
MIRRPDAKGLVVVAVSALALGTLLSIGAVLFLKKPADLKDAVSSYIRITD